MVSGGRERWIGAACEVVARGFFGGSGVGLVGFGFVDPRRGAGGRVADIRV